MTLADLVIGIGILIHDGATMADLDRLDKVGADKDNEKNGTHNSPNLSNTGMKGLNNQQRAQYIRNLRGGILHADEERRIYELFLSAPSTADRKAVYKLVEGHDWTGKLIQDDSLWLVFQETKWRTPFIAVMNSKS